MRTCAPNDVPMNYDEETRLLANALAKIHVSELLGQMDKMSDDGVVEAIAILCRKYCRKCGRERRDYKCRCWDNVETW